MKTRLLLLLTSLAIISCTSTKSISESFDNSSTNGIFYGTMSFPKKKSKMDNFSLFYRLKGTNVKRKYKQNIYVKNAQKHPFTQYVKFTPEKETKDEYIYSFAFEVPDGNYEFYQLEKSILNAAGSVSFTSSEFSIEFDVKPGTLTYIGNYTFFEDGNENGALVEISDDQAKAINILKDEFRNINWNQSISDLPVNPNNKIFEIN